MLTRGVPLYARETFAFTSIIPSFVNVLEASQMRNGAKYHGKVFIDTTTRARTLAFINTPVDFTVLEVLPVQVEFITKSL